MEEYLWEAAKDGEVSGVRRILRNNPDLEVNWRHRS